MSHAETRSPRRRAPGRSPRPPRLRVTLPSPSPATCPIASRTSLDPSLPRTMRRLLPAPLAAAAAAFSLAAPAAAQFPAPARDAAQTVTVLRARRLFDGTGLTLVTDGVVVVTGD